MVSFAVGCFVGAVVTFAVLAFIIAAEDDDHERRR